MLPACNTMRTTTFGSLRFIGQCSECMDTSQYQIPLLGSLYINCTSNNITAYVDSMCVVKNATNRYSEAYNLTTAPCNDCVYMESRDRNPSIVSVSVFSYAFGLPSDNCTRMYNATDGNIFFALRRNDSYYAFHYSRFCNNTGYGVNLEYYGIPVCIPNPLPTTTTATTTTPPVTTTPTGTSTTSNPSQTSTSKVVTTVIENTSPVTTQLSSVLIVTAFENTKDDGSTTFLAVGIAVFGVLVFVAVVVAVFLLRKRRRSKQLKERQQQLEEVTTENVAEQKTVYDTFPDSVKSKSQYDNMEDLTVEMKNEYANSPHSTQRTYVNVPQGLVN